MTAPAIRCALAALSDRPFPWIASGVLVIAIIAYWPAAQALAEPWMNSSDYTHGFVLAGAALWALLRMPVPQCPRSRLLLLPLIFVLSLGWLAGFASRTVLVQQLTLPLVMWMSLGSMFGVAMLRRTAWLFGSLYLAVPLWDYSIPLLQACAVVVTESLSRLVGIPAFVSGNLIMIPAGTFEVAEGCSGLRYLLSTLSIAFVCSAFANYAPRQRAYLVALAVMLALVANWVRIFIIVCIGDWTDMQSSLVSDHELLGHVVYFIVALVPLLFIFRALAPAAKQDSSSQPIDGSASWTPRLTAVAATVLMVVAVPVWARYKDDVQYSGMHATISLPNADQGWNVSSRASAPWDPSFPGAVATATRTYSSARPGSVVVYQASFLEQLQGAELVGLMARPFGSWRVLDEQATPSGASAEIEQTIALSESNEAWLIWHWYQIGSARSHSPVETKILELVRWFAAPSPASFVAVATRCEPDCAHASATLTDFLSTYPTLETNSTVRIAASEDSTAPPSVRSMVERE